MAFDKPQPITRILPVLINSDGLICEHTFDEQSGRIMQLSLYPDSGAAIAAVIVLFVISLFFGRKR